MVTFCTKKTETGASIVAGMYQNMYILSAAEVLGVFMQTN